MKLFNWHGWQWALSHQRVMYWQEKNTLIASDLHLGKTGHFRKSGIAMPQEIMKQDLMRLFHLIQFFKAERVLIVGDLFHSTANKELDWFTRWRKDLQQTNWLLVQGNHDILHADWYAQNGITVTPQWQEENIFFVHEPNNEMPENADGVISGHVHPGITLSSTGKQSLRMPCFYFSEQECILPAFGLFTGTFTLKPKKKDVVFALTDKAIIQL